MSTIMDSRQGGAVGGKGKPKSKDPSRLCSQLGANRVIKRVRATKGIGKNKNAGRKAEDYTGRECGGTGW